MRFLNILIPFNLIIDTDFGLVKLIQRDYFNKDVFLPTMLLSNDSSLKYFLMEREDPNPLLMLMQEEDTELANDLYNQFIEKEYENILKMSCTTSLASLNKMIQKSIDTIAKVTVLCSCQEEIDELKRRDIFVNNVMIGEYEDINITKYDAFYVKESFDMFRFKYLEGKSIYVPSYAFNITFIENDDTPLFDEEILKAFGRDNELFTFSIYNLRANEIPIE